MTGNDKVGKIKIKGREKRGEEMLEKIWNAIVNVPIPDIVEVFLMLIFLAGIILVSPFFVLYFKIKENQARKNKDKVAINKIRKKVVIYEKKLIVSGVLVLFIAVVNVKQIRVIWKNYAEPVLEIFVSVNEKMETMPNDVLQPETIIERVGDNDEEENMEQVINIESERYYNPESRLYLTPIPEWVEISSDEIFFGVDSEQLEQGVYSKNAMYSELEREILGRIHMSKKDVVQDGSFWEDMQEWLKYQNKVLAVTRKNDYFFGEVERMRKEPPALQGTWQWYRFLPKSEELFYIIDEQEKFVENNGNIEIAQQLYNNYWILGREYELQKIDGMTSPIKCYLKAGFYLLKKLEYEDITIDNCYKTLVCLRQVYKNIAICEKNEKNIVGKNAEILYELLSRFMDEHLTVRVLENDPIMMRNVGN